MYSFSLFILVILRYSEDDKSNISFIYDSKSIFCYMSSGSPNQCQFASWNLTRVWGYYRDNTLGDFLQAQPLIPIEYTA